MEDKLYTFANAGHRRPPVEALHANIGRPPGSTIILWGGGAGRGGSRRASSAGLRCVSERPDSNYYRSGGLGRSI